MVQQTISVFFIAVAISQLFSGVLSEHFGRKPVALIAAILFAMGSWCCAQADSVELLIEARAIQGLGVVGLYLLCRTILQDSYTKTELMRILAWFGVLFTIFVFGSGLITTVVAVSALYLFPNHKGQAGSIYASMKMAGMFLVTQVLSHVESTSLVLTPSLAVFAVSSLLAWLYQQKHISR